MVDLIESPATPDMSNSSENGDAGIKLAPSRRLAQEDPFDLDKLRVSQNFAAGLGGVKKVVTTIPVRKPDKQVFFRVHPSPDYRLETGVLELKEEGEVYIVSSDLWAELSGEITFKALLTAIDRQGNLFIPHVRLPGNDGRLDNWNRSAVEVFALAERQWIRMASNRQLGAYEAMAAQAPIPDPKWPDFAFKDILRIAFKGRFITSLDHPVAKRLRGEDV